MKNPQLANNVASFIYGLTEDQTVTSIKYANASLARFDKEKDVSKNVLALTADLYEKVARTDAPAYFLIKHAYQTPVENWTTAHDTLVKHASKLLYRLTTIEKQANIGSFFSGLLSAGGIGTDLLLALLGAGAGAGVLGAGLSHYVDRGATEDDKSTTTMTAHKKLLKQQIKEMEEDIADSREFHLAEEATV